MVSGHYPFLGDTLQETYDKVQKKKVSVLPFFFLITLRKAHLSGCYTIDCQ
jgi:hypothetical protein